MSDITHGDDGFERRLREAASEAYNPPPEPPRDEMWRGIEAEWRARREARHARQPRRRGSHRGRRGARRWLHWGAGLAAMLAVGIGIGRLSAPGADPADGAGPATAATEPAGAATEGVERGADGATGSMGPAAADSEGRRMLRAETPYRFAAAQVLGQAEVLLTAFGAGADPTRAVDAETVAWATDVLTTTRLLLDSPAADDPQLRMLLEDLELTLVQIVQLTDGAEAGAADWVRQAMRDRHVLTRLRTAFPPGELAAGT